MKSGSKRLLIFEILIILLLFLNNFVSSILRGYVEVILLIVLLFLFYLLFGFEKDRHHLWKNVCIEIIIFLLIFFILYYLLGIIISFTKVNNYYTLVGLKNIFIPMISIIILKEILRYMMIKKAFDYRVLHIFACIFFIAFDLVGKFDISTFKTKYDTFVFVATIFLPIISKNILCSYVSYHVGYKPVIMYLLIVELYGYLMPIIPNPSQFVYSVIWLVVPLLLLYRIYNYLKKEKHDIKLERDYQRKKFVSLILPTAVVIFLVYIVSGYFHYQAIVIASGSMEDGISKGDIVIVEKIDDNTDLLEKGDVIAYRYNKIIIVHRLVNKIVSGGETYFYTKGDANNNIDNYKITKDMIIGVVNHKIPYIGYPTIWIKEL